MTCSMKVSFLHLSKPGTKLINWYLTPTLAVFQLYHGITKLTCNDNAICKSVNHEMIIRVDKIGKSVN